MNTCSGILKLGITTLGCKAGSLTKVSSDSESGGLASDLQQRTTGNFVKRDELWNY